jgi:predicted transglutaminase-like cysteine proteinase
VFRSAVIMSLAIGFSLLAGASPSHAADARATIPMITAAAAPAGFLTMCQRLPRECRASGEVDDARIQREARNRYWREAFGGADSPRPASDQGLPPHEASTGADLIPDAVSVELDGRVADATPDVDIGLMIPAPRDADYDAAPALAATAAEATPTVTMTTDLWARVRGVNQQVNRSIRAVSDMAHYGQADYWAPQSGGDESGDCEDYAMTKRHLLIETGVPSDALTFAIVRTSWGELHAVLILSTDDGDMVLDNLTPWIVRWDKTSFRWIERQMPGRPLDWRSVG